MKPTFFAALAAVLLLVGCRGEAEAPSADKKEGGSTRTREGTSTETSPAQVTLTEVNFQEQVLSSNKPVMVDVTATWCPPCQRMTPIVEELASDFRGRAVIAKLDGDENRTLVHRYNVGGYPTFLFFKNGEEVGRVEGATSKQDLAKRLDALIAEQ